VNDHTQQTFAKRHMTRLAFAYEFRVPYSTLADRVRKGEIALHFVENKIMIDVEEALRVVTIRKRAGPKVKPIVDLFA
jgi:hypothetical protein